MSVTVAAVVVTYNRRNLLQRCLTALAAQTRSPDAIIIFDNASTDGTDAWLRDYAAGENRAVVIRSTKNVGGAGGFHQGMKRAYQEGHDWIWVMDDDTIADPDALEQLLIAYEEYPEGERPMLLASVVRWQDGCPHPMNWPIIRLRNSHERRDGLKIIEHGHVPILASTYVSCLMSRYALEAHGLPISDFFIWSDDIEHTMGICRNGQGILVLRSRVLHATENCHSWQDAVPARFYYHVRNGIWTGRFGRGLSPEDRPRHLVHHLISLVRYQFRHWYRLDSWWWLCRGLLEGWLTRPVEMVSRLVDPTRSCPAEEPS